MNRRSRHGAAGSVAADRIRKRSMLAAIGHAVRGFIATVQSAGTNSALFFVAVNEAINLRNAVRQQLDAQHTIEAKITEEAVNAGPDWIAQHELREAHDAYASGQFISLTPAELRDRAARKVHDGDKAQAEA